MKNIIVAVLGVVVMATHVPVESAVIPTKPRTWLIRDFAQVNAGTVITTGPSRTRQVGLDVLDRGGSAVDAALASALARITLDMGNIVSFAGIYMMVYYEASTGNVYSLNACFKTPLEEGDPLSIPRSGIPNGRAVLVPGFMAGVQAAHDRFGKLPRADIFAPAIDIAENGFTLTSGTVQHIRNHWDVLGVLPETREIFEGHQAGDLFVQTALGYTLRQVASRGAEYMYTGDWGRKFVSIVRREGGKITLQDMEDYEVVWADPAHTTYNGYDIHALGYPSQGAMNVILAFNLMEASNVSRYDHYSRSAEALYRLIYSSRVGEFFYLPYAPEVLKEQIPEGEFTYESLDEKETARLIWSRIESGEWPAIERQIAYRGNTRPSHSEAIIAADAEGNVAAVCHTINVDNWGDSGIFVDGVSIPGAGNFQQTFIDKIGPGQYLPDTTNPILVLQNGLPVAASSCIGSDLHSSTVQNLYSLLNFPMSPTEIGNLPKFQSIYWYDSQMRQKIQRNAFPQSLIDAVQAKGLGIMLVGQRSSEYWIGLYLTN